MAVFLVGAGPGDPGLLTVRGAEVLAEADVVVYDRLSVEALLDLAPPHAERISVGKAPGRVTMSQPDINALLVERGRTGATVVRLKGGDPFVFARGGEEAAALAAAGVPFEVVPGITSAIAAPAYAGIPVTLRHSSTSFTVVTGHEDPSVGDEGSVDWQAVARVGGTIVILMGVARIRRIADALMAGGRSPDTPVAAVRWGTRPEQRTVRATLGTIAAQDLASPSVIVVGGVAAVDLGWFEQRALFGRRVVVTRTRGQASQLAAALHGLGADPVEVPVIEVADPIDGGAALRRAAGALPTYDWVVVTSPNGAARLLEAVDAAGHDARAFAGARVAAIGPGTAATLRAGGIRADVVPDRFVAEALLDALPRPPASGGRVLLARAEVARDVLPDGLRARGWQVDVVDAYRSVPATVSPEQRAAVASADIVTFTSSSTVERFLDAFGAESVPPVVACIGPITAGTARQRGLVVDVEAPVHTIDGLVAALASWAATAPARRP
ncbi:MAG: uroporphyrinogen-III C-methyltransferase [Acidimicrobiales bacterium]|nr:uroporphyrinogen-III C-methyltransferase [Acidimicrobiales bacterium]